MPIVAAFLGVGTNVYKKLQQSKITEMGRSVQKAKIASDEKIASQRLALEKKAIKASQDIELQNMQAQKIETLANVAQNKAALDFEKSLALRYPNSAPERAPGLIDNINSFIHSIFRGG